ncbi:hypothetical protein GCM10010174_46990 [Kutzneria viridogrisea]|uniref:Uncharacterized protein n=1 Tax=Kutzneria viridogrisea TaxID=47990 RepID=A0ABR6BIK8_9PSEU|nr:hypothetical protein [Kutzneria viridogrisea]
MRQDLLNSVDAGRRAFVGTCEDIAELRDEGGIPEAMLASLRQLTVHCGQCQSLRGPSPMAH